MYHSPFDPAGPKFLPQSAKYISVQLAEYNEIFLPSMAQSHKFSKRWVPKASALASFWSENHTRSTWTELFLLSIRIQPQRTSFPHENGSCSRSCLIVGTLVERKILLRRVSFCCCWLLTIQTKADWCVFSIRFVSFLRCCQSSSNS